MKPPVIADNFGDLLIFESVGQAEGYLEAIDVLNNEYVLYDSEGRLLRALARSADDQVTIEDAESVPQHQAQLRDALIGFLSRIGRGREELRHCTLEQLVAKGVEYPTG